MAPEEAQRTWRVRPALPVVKLFGAAALAALPALLGDVDPLGRWMALAVAAGLLGWGARDVLAPQRLAADATGLTVPAGFLGRRRLTWPEVQRIRIDRRNRFGLASDLLEIDTGEALHLFSAYDLNAPPAEVAEELARLRPAAD